MEYLPCLEYLPFAGNDCMKEDNRMDSVENKLVLDMVKKETSRLTNAITRDHIYG